jgi:arabinan endo-1,5-alpha-L-arabinosidase
MSVVINDVTYKGVFFLQSDESLTNEKVMTFSAIGNNNESIWGSKSNISDQEKVNAATESLLLNTSKLIDNIALPTKGSYGTTISWVSSSPEIISETGVVNRLNEDTVVVLTATISKGTQLLTKTFELTVKGKGLYVNKINIKPIYKYDFCKVLKDSEIKNIGSKKGNAKLIGSAAIAKDDMRGNVLQINNETGAIKVNYLQLPTDTLDGITQAGFTVGMWVNINTSITGYSQHSALFEANGGAAGIYPMTRISSNLWTRINSNGAYVDSKGMSKQLKSNEWQYLSYTVNKDEIMTYLDGKLIGFVEKDLTNCFADNSLASMINVSIGSGNIWNDKDVTSGKFDNVTVYNSALTEYEIEVLYKIENKMHKLKK